MTIRPAIAAPIDDLASAKAWIDGLADAGLSFHFDDDPADIYNTATGANTFDESEWPILRERVASLFAIPAEQWAGFECPFGYMIHALELRDELPREPRTWFVAVTGTLYGLASDGRHVCPSNDYVQTYSDEEKARHTLPAGCEWVEFTS